MTLYCGIDLHANNVLVSIINEQDTVLFEKRLPNAISSILQRTLQHLSLHSLICRHTGVRLTNAQIKTLDSKKLSGFFINQHVLLAAQTACGLMKSTKKSIDDIGDAKRS